MGGLGPGIGGMEYIIIAIVALIVVGPERLPAMLHKLGKMLGKARTMANEFRASFDEMARQSELDDLRKEVEALRRGQTNMMPLGAEAEATFKSIADDLNRPATALPAAADPVGAVDEWPDTAPVTEPLETPPAEAAAPPKAGKPKTARPKAAAKPASTRVKAAPKPGATSRKKAAEL